MKRFLFLIILLLAIVNICQAASTLPLNNAFLQSSLDGRGQGVTNVFLTVTNMTTTQRVTFTPSNGTIVYDSTLNQLYQFAAGSWSAIGSGGGGGSSSNITGITPINVTPGGGNAAVSLGNTGSAGTYQSTTFNAQGLETSGGPLTAAMIPQLTGTNVPTGTVNAATNFTGNLVGDVTGTQGATVIPTNSGTGQLFLRTNGPTQTAYGPLNFIGSIYLFSNNIIFVTNSVIQIGTAQGDQPIIKVGDATNNAKFQIAFNSTHGGGQPNGDSSETEVSGNNLSINLEGHFQLTKIFSVNPTAVYLTRWLDATTLIPVVNSQAFDFQFAYYNNGEQISQIPIRAEPQGTNGTVSLTFHDPPPPGSDVTNVSGANRFQVISPIGTQTWGAIISDVQTVAVGSNATLLVDLLHPNEDVRLNGPVTVVLSNLFILNPTNENFETMQVWFNSGLVGNCPITWNFGPAVTTNWESQFGPIAAPTNCPAGSVLHFTFTPFIRDGVTNLTCSYQMENFTPVIDTLAQSFFTACPALLPQESNQVNYLVKDLRKWNYLPIFDALYPHVGGNSNGCSWNLIDTTQFRLAYTLGSSTFDHSGWTSDGTASFANTQFNPSTATAPNYTQNSASMFVYCGTANPAYASSPILWMGGVGGGVRGGIGMSGSAILSGSGLNNNDFIGAGANVSGVTSFLGMNLLTRTDSTHNTLFAPIGGNNGNVDVSTGVPNAQFYLGANNNGGLDRPAALKFETVGIGGAVPLAQVPTLTAIITMFNQGLNR